MRLFKAFSRMRFPGRSMVWFDSPRPTGRQIRQDVGDGTGANVVMTPIRWLQRSFVEAPIVVQRNDEPVDDHALAQLVRRPNPFYSGDHLVAATILSLSVDGNAYWLPVVNGRGRPIELWYVPHTNMEPKWPDDGDEFISHYEYTVAGTKHELAPDEVIHFRDGIDPQNMRKGLSPLKALFREVWTDMEASNMVAALMKNGGIPGVVISPDTDQPVDDGDAEALKQHIENEFTREKRGKPMVLKGRTKVEQFGFSPSELDLSAIRNISEERVCAALGVPAAVVGFGTGINQTKVGATMKELRRLAWYNGIIPLQRIIAGELETALLPMMLRGSGARESVSFDNDEVNALQEDANERAERIRGYVKDGIWTVKEGREESGMEAEETDDVYLRGFNIVAVPRGQRRAPVAPQPPQRRAHAALKHSHSLTEERIAREAPEVRRPPQQLLELANRLERIRLNAPFSMEDELVSFFSDLGEAAERESEPFVKQRESIESDQILQGLGMADRLPIFGAIYTRSYMRVAEEVDTAISEMFSLEVGLPDPHARAIMAASGTRAGLVDLTEQTRRAVFDGLTEGRAQGMAGENLARLIRSKVEAGPWSSPTIRARVIARTETAFAVNKASVEKMKAVEGVERAMIFDNRTGFDDPVCAAMNQRVVTLQEAEQLVADEHPNGTRSMAPVTQTLLEEMGIEV